MFKKIGIAFFSVLLHFPIFTAASPAFLVIGVSEAELQPHPAFGLHPLIKAFNEHELPPETYFLDKQNPHDQTSPYFIHADFSDECFEELAARFPEKFTSIYFDWSTAKFINLDTAAGRIVFQTLFKMLQKGARLYIPQPGPSMIHAKLPMPDDVKVWRDDPISNAWKKENRAAIMAEYMEKLSNVLSESGFRFQTVSNTGIQDPVFDLIRQRIISTEEFIGRESKEEIQNFPVLVAEKTRA